MKGDIFIFPKRQIEDKENKMCSLIYREPKKKLYKSVLEFGWLETDQWVKDLPH